ncbi:MAG: ComF family protein [Solirubrobacteraceae bacterium]
MLRLASLAADLLPALVAPDRCWHCRGAARTAEPLCGACRAALPWLPRHGCARCGLPTPCMPRRCPGRGGPIAAAWAPLAYEGPARSLAIAGKRAAAIRVAPWFAAAMVARAPRAVVAGVDAVVPVPSDPRRRRARGVDHAALLADAVASALGVPVAPVLERPEGRPSQHAAARHERLRLPPPRVRATVPRRVVVVDDVHTTGATLRAAGSALRAAGAVRVTALTALRTLR